MKTLKLEVGKTYRSRKGKEVKIVRTNNSEFWPFVGDNDRSYAESGSCWYSKDLDDLIEEVPSETTRHTFTIPDGVKEITIEQVGNRIVVEMVPEEAKEPKPGDSKFKEGDVVFEDGRVMIVKSYPNHFYAYTYPKTGGLYIDEEYGLPFTAPTFRLATPEESKPLFDALKKAGKRWNPETMQVEDIPEIDHIREWVAKRLGDGRYDQEWVAQVISHYLKHREGK